MRTAKREAKRVTPGHAKHECPECGEAPCVCIDLTDERCGWCGNGPATVICSYCQAVLDVAKSRVPFLA